MDHSNEIKSRLRTVHDMDLVGIAPASALANEPNGHRPTDLLPGAKSVIVFGRAFADGAVLVNGAPCTQRGKKLRGGDTVRFGPDEYRVKQA